MNFLNESLEEKESPMHDWIREIVMYKAAIFIVTTRTFHTICF